MPQRHHSLSALEARKKMLVLEAEINRLRLKAEAQEVVANVEAMVDSAKDYAKKGAAIISSVALAGAAVKAVSALRHKSHSESGGKPSFFSRAFSAARMGVSMWRTFKGHSNEERGE